MRLLIAGETTCKPCGTSLLRLNSATPLQTAFADNGRCHSYRCFNVWLLQMPTTGVSWISQTVSTQGNLAFEPWLIWNPSGCLRQALTLLQVYSEDIDLLMCKLNILRIYRLLNRAVIGQNWLLRAQKLLCRIHHTEQGSSSSGSAGSQDPPLSSSEEQRRAIKATIEAEDRLHSADYVEARGILLPAVEYLKHAVDAAVLRNDLSGSLLSMVRTAYPECLSSDTT
jgi:hypothetical protein